MGKYRTINTELNRHYRNDLNWNFEQIDEDIKNSNNISETNKNSLRAELARIERESKERDDVLSDGSLNVLLQSIEAAKKNADVAATNAEEKAAAVTQKGEYASQKGDYADEKGLYALQKGDYADEKAKLADTAAANADAERANLDAMKIAVTDATTAANERAVYIDGKKPLIDKAIEESGVAKTTAETVRGEFDQVIAEAGSSNPEVVNARGTFTNLKQRLDSTAQQLADTAHRIVSTAKKSKALATVVYDDGYIWDYTKVFPYFQSKGIVGSSALISNFVNSDDARFLNTAKINEMKAYGWEFLAHTKTHTVLPTLDYEKQFIELTQSKQELQALGLDIEGVVYPENKYDSNTLEITRDHYNFGMAMDMTYRKRHINYAPVNQYALYRIELENSPANVKPLVDKAISNGGWIILMGHTNRYDDSRSDINPAQMWSNMVANIEYLIQSGIEITTAKKAMETFGNKVSVGDDLLSSGRFSVSNNGVAGGNGILSAELIDKSGVVNNSTPASYFADNTYTVVSVLTADNAGFPTVGGTLHVYNFGERLDFTTQIWMPYDNNDSYTRRWLWSTKQWTIWDKTSDGKLSVPATNSSITANSPVQSFTPNKIEVHSFLHADGGLGKGFPTDAGHLITNSVGSIALSNQEWIPYESKDRYKRYWKVSEKSWSAWHKEGWTVTRYNLPIPILIPNNVTIKTENITGLKTHSVIAFQLMEEPYGNDVIVTAKCLTDGVLTLAFRNFSDTSKSAVTIKTSIAFVNP